MIRKFGDNEFKIEVKSAGVILPDIINLNGTKYTKEEKPREVHLTEFQKLIVNCKPEINKPVFVLCGAGAGKTFALNERAKNIDFLYFKDVINANVFREHNKCWNIKNIHTRFQGFEEIVFEGYLSPLLVSSFIDEKRIIVFTNGVDFVKDFANRLKGEYTIISGFNVRDNPYLDNSAYEECLNSLHSNDRKRYLDGGF